MRLLQDLKQGNFPKEGQLEVQTVHMLFLLFFIFIYRERDFTALTFGPDEIEKLVVTPNMIWKQGVTRMNQQTFAEQLISYLTNSHCSKVKLSLEKSYTQRDKKRNSFFFSYFFVNGKVTRPLRDGKSSTGVSVASGNDIMKSVKNM